MPGLRQRFGQGFGFGCGSPRGWHWVGMGSPPPPPPPGSGGAGWGSCPFWPLLGDQRPPVKGGGACVAQHPATRNLDSATTRPGVACLRFATTTGHHPLPKTCTPPAVYGAMTLIHPLVPTEAEGGGCCTLGAATAPAGHMGLALMHSAWGTCSVHGPRMGWWLGEGRAKWGACGMHAECMGSAAGPVQGARPGEGRSPQALWLCCLVDTHLSAPDVQQRRGALRRAHVVYPIHRLHDTGIIYHA